MIAVTNKLWPRPVRLIQENEKYFEYVLHNDSALIGHDLFRPKR
jgi:hypothetical protein